MGGDTNTGGWTGSRPAGTTAAPAGKARGGAWLWLAAAAAGWGAFLAGLSTRDFVLHLDRQVHAVHCSLVPGAAADVGATGCKTAMLSPYSSLFRESLWGGLPISLLGLAVFAFLAARAVHLALSPSRTRRDALFFVLAALVPVGSSAVYGTISMLELGEICELCLGMYVASGLILLFGLVALARAPKAAAGTPFVGRWALGFVEGVACVAVIVAAYVGLAPPGDVGRDGCGAVPQLGDPAGILVRMGGADDGTPAVAVLDPLCAACQAFHERIRRSALHERLRLSTLLFPLDAKCNWMVQSSLHPGACAVSEAILCAPEHGQEVLEWAFTRREELLELGAKDEPAVVRAVAEAFPVVAGCLGTAKIRNKLNKSLRWAVANALPVLTPQLVVGERRVCDEDTDLGLEYTVLSMLAGAAPAGEGR